MAYINSTRTVVNNVGTDIALAGAGNLFTVSGSLGGTKSLTLSDGFINNGAPEANLIVPLLFPNGHNDLGPSLYLEITVAGVANPISVVSNQNGTLLPIPHHEMIEGGSTVYKVVDPNTILNVYYTADYDGNGTPAFVVVGNPLVLSSSSYSIYANGWNDTEVYSTNEIKTNKVWIDGKPIYRKCFYSATNWALDTNVGTINNVDMPICIRNISANNSTSGVMTYIENYGDYYGGGGDVVTSGATFKINTTTRVGTVVAARRAQFANNYPSCIIVEYTKTSS